MHIGIQDRPLQCMLPRRITSVATSEVSWQYSHVRRTEILLYVCINKYYPHPHDISTHTHVTWLFTNNYSYTNANWYIFNPQMAGSYSDSVIQLVFFIPLPFTHSTPLQKGK